jgi:hypothetical protein
MNVATIQRGSLYLSDDFVQAMTYNSPAQISSFALLKLPAWRKSEMYIEASELGMPAGTVSPNDILPAAFSQYWQNLCGYARQYHASLDIGEDIEDFSEQAFWKLLMRLMPDRADIDDLAEFVVAKSTDVLTNTNSVDGNMYTELILNVNANIKQQTVSFAVNKPDYLQTIGKLPNTAAMTILNGHDLALYDNNKTYYDLQEQYCKTVQFADVEDASAEFEFNAILLYYELGDVEQLAGIYFPNPYVPNSTGGFALPMIQKLSDVSLGYSINISYNVGSAYTYNAANADQGVAMQVYNNMYKLMANANLQLNSLSKRMLEQEQELASVKSMIESGYLTGIANKVDKLQKQIATTYRGSVSTNKLLELFLAAKQNAGQLTLTAMLTDLSQAMTGRTISVTNDVGAYHNGDSIPIGTSITEIIANMLKQTTAIEYEQPYGTLAYNGTTDKAYVDYASLEGGIAVQCTLVQADAGPFTFPVKVTMTVNGHTSIQTITDTNATVNFKDDALGINTALIALSANYGTGEVKPGDESGEDRVYAGMLNLELRIIPVFDAYIGSIAVLENLASSLLNNLSSYNKVRSNTLSTLYNGANDYQVLAIPANVECPVINVVSATYDFDVNGTAYKAYAVKSRTLNINTANLV